MIFEDLPAIKVGNRYQSLASTRSVGASFFAFFKTFHEYDQVPALINDRTLVPLRAILEAFGADVERNANGKTVLINE